MKKVIIFVLCSIIFINDSHNVQVSKETRNRSLLYESFVELTSKTNMFSKVHDGDVFISKTQDDAYESNRGQFYYRTGIRLVGMLQPRILWPELENCGEETNCPVLRSRPQILERIQNFRRVNASANVQDGKKRTDWVEELINQSKLTSSRIWLFEIFKLTNNTLVAYLIPVKELSSGDFANLYEARVVSVSDSNTEDFRLSLEGICLIEAFNFGYSSSVSDYGFRSNLISKFWEFPKSSKIDLEHQTNFSKKLFYDLNIGIC